LFRYVWSGERFRGRSVEEAAQQPPRERMVEALNGGGEINYLGIYKWKAAGMREWEQLEDGMGIGNEWMIGWMGRGKGRICGSPAAKSPAEANTGRERAESWAERESFCGIIMLIQCIKLRNELWFILPKDYLFQTISTVPYLSNLNNPDDFDSFSKHL
jgi:hypothetical protein